MCGCLCACLDDIGEMASNYLERNFCCKSWCVRYITAYFSQLPQLTLIILSLWCFGCPHTDGHILYMCHSSLCLCVCQMSISLKQEPCPIFWYSTGSPFSVCPHTIAPGTNNGATVTGHSPPQARQQTYSCVKTDKSCIRKLIFFRNANTLEMTPAHEPYEHQNNEIRN